MPKHITGASPSEKIRYAAGPTRIPLNKRRRLAKHIRKQPGDFQAQQDLARLGGPV